MRVAIVIGGSEAVWDEIDMAREMCCRLGMEPTMVVTNDMIADFPDDGVGATLHAEKLSRWLAARVAAGRPPLAPVVCPKPGPGITHLLADWGGSVGLYGAKAAIEHLGADRVLLAGVPMCAKSRHYKTGREWPVRDIFWPSWERHSARGTLSRVRSFSGPTRELLGEPTEAWLAA